MKPTFTLLIPFYNEGNRLLTTLSVLTKSNYISETICVDDGSTDNSAESVKKLFPSVKIVALLKNKGKSQAVKEGLSFVTTSHVLLFDADLSNIHLTEVDAALEKILKNREVDMIILRRIVESKLLFLLRHDVVMSGQRILKTEDLHNVFKKNPDGYALETAINAYMIENNKKVYWMPITTQNPTHFHKWGYRNIIAGESLKGYFSSVGFTGYIKQIVTFCKESV